MRLFFHLVLIVILTCSDLALARSAPMCPSENDSCYFQGVHQNLASLDDTKFMGALSSAKQACDKGFQAPLKGDSAFKALVTTPTFSNYATQQMSCWSQMKGSADEKTKVFSRYLYLQKRFDNEAEKQIDYLAYAASLEPRNQQTIFSKFDCHAEFGSLKGAAKKCDDSKAQCQSKNNLGGLAKQFKEDFKDYKIQEIRDRIGVLDKIISSHKEISSSDRRSGIQVAEKVEDVKADSQFVSANVMSNWKKEKAALALRLDQFYGSYPWASQETFNHTLAANPKDVESAILAQVRENARAVKSNIKALNTGAHCLNGTLCEKERIEDAIKASDELDTFSAAGFKNKSLETRETVAQHLIYNNCLDRMYSDQADTSKVLWSSATQAALAAATAGAGVAVSGLSAGGKTWVAAAQTGSRLASLGKGAQVTNSALNGVVTGDTVKAAAESCLHNSLQAQRKSSDQVGSGENSCGAISQKVFSFKKEHDDCVMQSAMAAIGVVSSGIGVKDFLDSRKIAAVHESTFALSVRPEENAANAKTAVDLIRAKAKPEEVRAYVGKIDDSEQGLAERMKVAEATIGRPLTPEEANWIKEGHLKYADAGYGKLGVEKLKGKLKDRPKTIDQEQTRRLVENGVLGSENPIRPVDIHTVSQQSPIRIENSRYYGEKQLAIKIDGKTQYPVIVGSYADANGDIWHRLQFPKDGSFAKVTTLDVKESYLVSKGAVRTSLQAKGPNESMASYLEKSDVFRSLAPDMQRATIHNLYAVPGKSVTTMSPSELDKAYAAMLKDDPNLANPAYLAENSRAVEMAAAKAGRMPNPQWADSNARKQLFKEIAERKKQLLASNVTTKPLAAGSPKASGLVGSNPLGSGDKAALLPKSRDVVTEHKVSSPGSVAAPTPAEVAVLNKSAFKGGSHALMNGPDGKPALVEIGAPYLEGNPPTIHYKVTQKDGDFRFVKNMTEEELKRDVRSQVELSSIGNMDSQHILLSEMHFNDARGRPVDIRMTGREKKDANGVTLHEYVLTDADRGSNIYWANDEQTQNLQKQLGDKMRVVYGDPAKAHASTFVAVDPKVARARARMADDGAVQQPAQQNKTNVAFASKIKDVVSKPPSSAPRIMRGVVTPEQVYRPVNTAVSTADQLRYSELTRKIAPTLEQGGKYFKSGAYNAAMYSDFPDEGFKLHIGFAPGSATKVMEKLIPQLQKMEVTHKYPRDLGEYAAREGRQAGKAITIYPKSPEDAARIAKEIDKLVRDRSSGLSPSDFTYTNNEVVVGMGVTSRYGILSGKEAYIKNPKTGEQVLDVGNRDPIPPWVSNPFEK